MMLTLARYTLIEALRNRLLRLSMLGLFAGIGLSIFLGRIAITDSIRVGLGVEAALFRLFAVFSTCIFVLSGMLREYHDKGLEFLLAMDMSRSTYFFGKFLGYAGCALFLALLYSAPLLYGGGFASVLAWGISLFLELSMMVAVSLFFALAFSQMPSALAAVAGFYLISRSMGTLLLIMNGPLATRDLTGNLLDAALLGVGWFLPRLDAFTRTSWLLHVRPTLHDLQVVFVQAAIYLVLISSAALYDFYRKSL